MLIAHLILDYVTRDSFRLAIAFSFEHISNQRNFSLSLLHFILSWFIFIIIATVFFSQFSLLFSFLFVLCRWQRIDFVCVFLWPGRISIICEFVALCIDCTTINLWTVETWRSQIDNRTVKRKKNAYLLYSIEREINLFRMQIKWNV